jgi:hypothetical protein
MASEQQLNTAIQVLREAKRRLIDEEIDLMKAKLASVYAERAQDAAAIDATKARFDQQAAVVINCHTLVDNATDEVLQAYVALVEIP